MLKPDLIMDILDQDMAEAGKQKACDEGPGICSHLLTLFSILLIMATMPLSLLWTVKVVQEYERAVIFRLGRLLSGGARGPGVFFIIPCVDIYEKIDMRTKTYEIPPQEVGEDRIADQLIILHPRS